MTDADELHLLGENALRDVFLVRYEWLVRGEQEITIGKSSRGIPLDIRVAGVSQTHGTAAVFLRNIRTLDRNDVPCRWDFHLLDDELHHFEFVLGQIVIRLKVGLQGQPFLSWKAQFVVTFLLSIERPVAAEQIHRIELDPAFMFGDEKCESCPDAFERTAEKKGSVVSGKPAVWRLDRLDAVRARL